MGRGGRQEMRGVGLTQAGAQLEPEEAASDTSERAGRKGLGGRSGRVPKGLEACMEPCSLSPAQLSFDRSERAPQEDRPGRCGLGLPDRAPFQSPALTLLSVTWPQPFPLGASAAPLTNEAGLAWGALGLLRAGLAQLRGTNCGG